MRQSTVLFFVSMAVATNLRYVEAKEPATGDTPTAL